MDQIDNELECRSRELPAYLDTESTIEESLPFAIAFQIKEMRAAILAKAARTFEPAQCCDRARRNFPRIHTVFPYSMIRNYEMASAFYAESLVSHPVEDPY
jgi:hypothetical protein